MKVFKTILSWIGKALVVVILLGMVAFVAYKGRIYEKNSKPYQGESQKAYVVINDETIELEIDAVKYYSVNRDVIVEVRTTDGDIYTGSPDNITVISTSRNK